MAKGRRRTDYGWLNTDRYHSQPRGPFVSLWTRLSLGSGVTLGPGRPWCSSYALCPRVSLRTCRPLRPGQSLRAGSAL